MLPDTNDCSIVLVEVEYEQDNTCDFAGNPNKLVTVAVHDFEIVAFDGTFEPAVPSFLVPLKELCFQLEPSIADMPDWA